MNKLVNRSHYTKINVIRLKDLETAKRLSGLQKELISLTSEVESKITNLRIGGIEINDLKNGCEVSRHCVLYSERVYKYYANLNKFKYKNLDIILFKTRESEKCIAFKLEEHDKYIGFVIPTSIWKINRNMKPFLVTVEFEDVKNNKFQLKRKCIYLIKEFLENISDYIYSEFEWMQYLKTKN